MNATVIVAIAGLIGTSSGALLSYKAGRASSQDETARQAALHEEEERRNRQGTYHQLLALVLEIIWVDADRLDDLLDRWYLLNAGVTLFGAPPVVKQTRLLSDLLAKGGDESKVDSWRAEVRAQSRKVVAAMREDIGVKKLAPGG